MLRADFLPFRQIHLDFHTSEAIDGVGAGFDPDEFASTLAKAHVNSITCFAPWAGENLPFSVEGSRIAFSVPKVLGHQMIEINFV